MKIKILTTFTSGRTRIEEIEIETFDWKPYHQFEFVRIWNGHSMCRYEKLQDNQELIGIEI